MTGFETYDRDDPPEVAAVTIFMRRDADGLPVYTPRCMDWVSLLPEEAAAQVCAYAAAACDKLAESLDPDVNRDEGEAAPVISLAAEREERDDGAA